MNDILSLKLDKMCNNNPLAMEYFTKHMHIFFHSKNCDYTVDNCQNKIYNESEVKFHAYNKEIKRENIYDALVKNIEDNAKLIWELEYLLRGRPKEDVKSDLKLLTQFLRYFRNIATPTDKITLHVADDTSLAELGLSLNVSAVKEKKPNAANRLGTGCLGVVTENSDADSAVDALLASSTKYPWTVRRILIQESVYESVVKTLQWKCQLKGGQVDVEEGTKKLCEELMVYGERTLLVRYAGSTRTAVTKGAVVLVDAYRTTNELLSLITQYSPWCVSLWCNDINQVNEISFATSTDVGILWVNEHAVFEGPPRVAMGFYTNIYNESKHIKKHEEIVKLMELRKSWVKLQLSERVKILEKCVQSLNIGSINKYFQFLNLDVANRALEKFVEVDGGRLCVGIPNQPEVMLELQSEDNIQGSGYLVYALQALIGGTAVLFTYENDFVNILRSNGVPVLENYKYVAGDLKVAWCAHHRFVKLYENLYKTKVVYQNFGTIFAN